MTRSIAIAIVVASLAIAGLAHAEPATTTTTTTPTTTTPTPTPAEPKPVDTVTDEVIVVTGTRSPTPRASSPVVTEVIDRSQLQDSGVQSVSEALGMRPGLWIDRGVAGTNGVSIQGLGPQYSLVLVDGARQIGRTDGILDLDRFNVEDLEQIEIVRGPSSVLYGSDALGGVINLVTRPPKDGLSLTAQSRIDSRLGSDSRARATVGKDGIAGALIGEYRTSPAIRLDSSSIGTTIDAYEDRHITGRATHQRTPGWRFDASADYLWRDLRGISASPTGAVFDQRNLVETASVATSAQYSGERTGVRVAADTSRYRDQYLNDQRESDQLDQYQETLENLVEGSVQLSRTFERHRGLVGVEVLRETLESDRLTAPGDRTRAAVFAQDEWKLGKSDAVVVVPAARLDVDTQFGTYASPRFAARWQIHAKLVTRASIGMGYRAPGFKELLLDFENPGAGYVVAGNPDLKPETSRSVQGGGEWQATRWLWLSADAYYNSLHDLIYAVTLPDDGSGTLQFSYANIGRARTTGLEALGIAMHGRASLELGAAITRARDFDANRALENIPAHRLTATARWRDKADGFEVFVAMVMTGHRPLYQGDDPQMATLTDRRFELRMRIAKRFTSGLGGFLGADNLLGAGDARLDRIPGRTLYAGVQAQL